MPAIPEYFSRIGRRPLYPELWEGCVGAWAPCLGPTGVTLRDWSGRQRHGTLTNTTLSTVWAVSQGAHGLSLDGTDDYVAVGSLGLTGDWTVKFWINIKGSAGQIYYPIGFHSGTAKGVFVEFGVSSDNWGLFDASSTLEASNLADGVWNCLAVRKFGTTYTLYRNGIQEASGTRNDIDITSFNIGRRSDFQPFYVDAWMDDIQVYDFAVAPSLLVTAALGRGIAYAPASRRRVFAVSASASSRLLNLRRRAAQCS